MLSSMFLLYSRLTVYKVDIWPKSQNIKLTFILCIHAVSINTYQSNWNLDSSLLDRQFGRWKDEPSFLPLASLSNKINNACFLQQVSSIQWGYFTFTEMWLLSVFDLNRDCQANTEQRSLNKVKRTKKCFSIKCLSSAVILSSGRQPWIIM